MNATGNGGDTALLYAARKGHLSMVRHLVEHGAAVNAAANNGETSLGAAARKGHLDVVRYLKSVGGR